MTTDVHNIKQFICPENSKFMQDELNEPVNKEEILSHLDKGLKKNSLISFPFIFVNVFLVLLWAIIIVIATVLIINLFTMVNVLISEQDFSEVYPAHYLLEIGIYSTFIIAGSKMFIKPFFMTTKSIFLLPYHYSSPQRLSKYMFDNMNLKEGIVFKITKDKDFWVVSYRFRENIQKKEWVDDNFSTTCTPTLELNDKINIITVYKANFPL